MDDWEELAIDYLDDAVDSATRAAIDTHLSSCSSCAARLGVQRAVSAAVKQTALEDAPVDLEDRVLGEIMFPSKPERTIRAAAAERSRWSDLWRKRFRPWIPATVAVVALFAALISFGVFRGGPGMESAGVTTTAAAAATTMNDAARSGEDMQVASAEASMTTAAPATTAAGAPTTTALASGGGELLPAGAGGTDVDQPPTGDTGTPSTTAAALTFGTQEPTYAPDVVIYQDKKDMIAELKAAEGPLFFVFEPGAGKAGDGSPGGTGDASADLATQVTMLTGLEPTVGSLALGRATFVAYVPKEDATAIVELLQSIASSLQLNLNLASRPISVASRPEGPEISAALREHEVEIPELDAQKKPPAVSVWTYTTSTLAPHSDDEQTSYQWVAPDEAGTHVLIVIYLAD